MTTLTEQAGALASALQKEIEAKRGTAFAGELGSLAAKAAGLLRQITALGDGEGLTDEQIKQLFIQSNLCVFEYDQEEDEEDSSYWSTSIKFHYDISWSAFLSTFRALIVAATLPLRAKIAELEGACAKAEARNVRLHEELAASQAQALALHAALADIAGDAEEEMGKRRLSVVNAFEALDAPLYLTAIHADRKATIERVRDAMPIGACGDPVANIIDEEWQGFLTQAAERAGRGEAI